MVLYGVLLSGEHSTLPLAELRALLAVHDPAATVSQQDGVALVETSNGAAAEAALQRMALAHETGLLLAQAPDSGIGLGQLVELARESLPRLGGTASVVSTRQGILRGVARTDLERRLGIVLRDCGYAIDLEHPEHVFFAWLLHGRIYLGLRQGSPTRSAYEARISDKRAHFSPVSLHPRRAASLLHLARVAPGGRVYDPFCGTGGFVLEAALEGYEVLGSDLDSFMVQGTWQTLTDMPPEPLDGVVFEADIAATPDLVDPVDGIVTDLPYGRSSGTDGEGLADLYRRGFKAMAQLLPAGRYAVIGHPDPRLLDPIQEFGFAIVERHEERAHRSLTRHFAVVKRLDDVAGLV